MNNSYAIFVQARMSSTRLPGKVLTDIVGYPMLFRQLDRLSNMTDIPVIVVTSDHASDDPIENMCASNGFTIFRGELNNVLSRFINAAVAHNISHIIRVGGDDPLIDPEACIYLQDLHKEFGGDFLYASNRDGWPYGCACELMSLDSLLDIRKRTSDELYLEHITPWFYSHRHDYEIKKIAAPANKHRPEYYFSVDYPEDVELIKTIFTRLIKKGDYFLLNDVINLCDQDPEILLVNKHLHSGFDE